MFSVFTLTTSTEKLSGLQAMWRGVSYSRFLWLTFPAERAMKNDVTMGQGNGGKLSSSRKELLLKAEPDEAAMCRRLSPRKVFKSKLHKSV